MTDAQTGLRRRERAAADPSSPAGLLVLLHGRGADGDDLAPLFDIVDPEARLHAVTLQAPDQLPGQPGFHWYQVHRVGSPHRPTFEPSLRLLEAEVDTLLAEHGLAHDRLVLGGFSQGSVMSIATAFGPGRPRPAAVFAWSGFVPDVEGWQLDPAAARDVPVLLTHGALDPVIVASFGHDAREQLEAAGAAVEWREPPMGHELDPATLVRARALAEQVTPTR